jgi:hypothetical protein
MGLIREKNRGQKSRATVPLSVYYGILKSVEFFLHHLQKKSYSILFHSDTFCHTTLFCRQS